MHNEFIRENLIKINKKIEDAARKSGRNIEDINLVAVTKTHPLVYILDAYELGIDSIGENRVQELMDKYDGLPKELNINFIGQLQTNKVKYIIDKVDLIQSLDRESLLTKIQNEAAKRGIIANCLIQINQTKDDNRAGIGYDEIEAFCEKIAACPNVKVRGLMCVAPLGLNEKEMRDIFSKMSLAFWRLKCYNIDNIVPEILSMGMTDDFELAIEEGANMVRIGSGIFGRRL
ncbi:MAG: YggS family pyridoxal phosphate-dependent enzyme [Ezakiella sp.]|nr:YggS family pyridoxal phosphate-dependent enzyme [Ezakiella sp.]